MPDRQQIDELRRLLNTHGLTRATTTALAEAVLPAAGTELTADASRLLPAPQALLPLLPWPGLRKGATVAVDGSTSLLLTLLAAAVSQGAWAAVAGVPALGCLAAAELGMPLDRLALVPNPGPDWPTVVGALIDGLDVVAVRAPGPVPERTVQALKSRARERGCVLIPLTACPGADVVLTTTSRRWEGLGRGRGRLRRQILEVTATGRGRAAQPRTVTVAIGVPRRQLVIPPPAAAPDSPPVAAAQSRAEADPWAAIEPNADPDMWAPLLRDIPPVERKRR